MKKVWMLAAAAAFLSLAQGARAQSWLEKKAPARSGKTAESGWFENLDEAKAEAKKSGRPIFALFTGSDWCGFCIRLEKEVLSGKLFKSFARDNLVLFKADYPNRRKVPPEIKSQNDALKNRLGGVGGFPTVLLITADEEVLGRKGGYGGQGPKEYVRQLREILEAKGVKTSKPGSRPAAQSPYERMKAEKAARARRDAERPASAPAAIRWFAEFGRAEAEAKKSGRPIFALFTGSDWCPWCVRLEREALSTDAFKTFAAANFVLFKADYLNSRKMPPELEKKNNALMTKFGASGFPTVVLLSADGELLEKTGYRRGGGEAYVRHLKGLLEKKGVKTDGPAGAR